MVTSSLTARKSMNVDFGIGILLSTRIPKLESRWLVGQASSLPFPAKDPEKNPRSLSAATDRQDARATTVGRCQLRDSGSMQSEEHVGCAVAEHEGVLRHAV